MSTMFVQSILLGPFERLKIVMQVAPQAIHASHIKDKPRGVIDFVTKINKSQGLSAYFRGAAALS